MVSRVDSSCRSFVGLHFKAYRAVSNKICGITATIFYNTILPEKICSLVKKTVTNIVQIPEIDYSKVTTQRLILKAYNKISKENVNLDNYKTLVQLRRENEVQSMRIDLKNKPSFIEFSRVIDELINELFPKIMSELVLKVPSLIEKICLYQLKIVYFYVNYQINRRTNYRERILTSSMFKNINQIFGYFRTNISQCILSEENIKPILNSEHISLKLLKGVDKKIGEAKSVPSMSDLLIASFAKSFKLMEEVDGYMKENKFDELSEKEAFIGVLQWYKKRGALPEGIPDPDAIPLNESNIIENLDKSLFEYLDQLSKEIVEALVPKRHKNKILGMAYWLEGKNGLIKLLSLLIGELGVRQIADPRLLAIALLNASGVETLDYEKDGFGRKNSRRVFNLGREIIEEKLKGKLNIFEITQLFYDSNLKASPQSYEGILQSQDLKKKLKDHIFTTIYNLIKPEEYQYKGGLKNIRESMQTLPLLGGATIGMHLLINGILFSCQYCKLDSQESFLAWMTRNLVGKNLCSSITDRIMELIYHPSLRVVILSLIQDIRTHLKQRVDILASEQEKITFENLKTINTFLIKHFMKEINLPLDTFTNYFFGENMVSQFKSFLKPGEKSIIEIAIESSIPKIKEFTLYIRCCETMRKKGIFFEGDDKFWEVFIREYINSQMSIFEIKTFEYREVIVDKLLKLNSTDFLNEMIKRVSDKPTVRLSSPISESIVEDYHMPNDTIPLEHPKNKKNSNEFTSDTPNLSAAIIEDYAKPKKNKKTDKTKILPISFIEDYTAQQ